jgi:multiple sugar transport system substrate-binding protein
MFLGGNWQIRELKDAMPPEEFAKWGVAPIPQLHEGPAPTGTGGWVWVVFAKDPEKRRAAAKFILDIEAPKNAARISGGTGRLPVRKSVYRDNDEFRQEPFAFFGQLLSAARARPAVPIYNAISRELQIAIGYAIEGTRTPEQAVDDAFRIVRDEDARRRASVSTAAGVDPPLWAPPAEPPCSAPSRSLEPRAKPLSPAGAPATLVAGFCRIRSSSFSAWPH